VIFVTVGTQMHFDRLIAAVDEWAGMARAKDVFAQTGPSRYLPKQIETKPFITPREFHDRAAQARIIIGHAGMGSILTALEFGKRILVMPRRSNLGEHRNDHQIATAKYFAMEGRILVAWDKEELFTKLDELSDERVEPISATASPELIATIRTFVESSSASATKRHVGRQHEVLNSDHPRRIA
jgi:UDP-N-acetylglucosamine transferase subunit ALG13